jgi:hypothetical protein
MIHRSKVIILYPAQPYNEYQHLSNLRNNLIYGDAKKQQRYICPPPPDFRILMTRYS